VVATVQNATFASIKANLSENFIAYAAQYNATHESVTIGAVQVTVTEVLHRPLNSTGGPSVVGKVRNSARITGVKTILVSFGLSFWCMY